MLIGFRIPSILPGQKVDAVTFILSVCPHVDSDIAANILRDPSLNIFSDNITDAILAALSFSTVPIYTTANITCISNVDFRLEVPYINDFGDYKTLRLNATELVDVTFREARQLLKYVNSGYLRLIPSIPQDTPADFSSLDFSPVDLYAE